MPYDPKAVANYFLQLAKGEGISLSPLKLIKLVYIAHGWHLGLSGQTLITEHPQAWRYGPVIPSLYHEFKRFGSDSITEFATEIVEDEEDGDWSFDIRKVPPLDPNENKSTCAFLQKVWDAYKANSGLQLSNLTHQEGTPWSEAWSKRGQYIKGTVISEESIRKHYEELARKNASDHSAAT